MESLALASVLGHDEEVVAAAVHGQLATQPVRQRILSLLEEGTALSSKKVSGMCREMLKLKPALFAFVDLERVEPTNNTAERAVRFAVLMRKGCFGSDSAKGSRFIERFLTARATLRSQKRDLYTFLKDACTAALHGTPAPSFLPAQFWDFLTSLQHTTPRVGLNAPTAAFVDHLVAMSGRWGSHLFNCFDDPDLPATTNQLEGAFGQFKRMLRRAVGAKSTSGSLATNLGAEVLMAWHQVRSGLTPDPQQPIDPQAHRTARAELDRLEQPARERRSWVRNPGRRLAALLSRWRASP